MDQPRVLMIGLDGFEPSLAEDLLRQGRLPALARLKARGATVLLDHGEAKRTGLAWEHVSTGQSPDDAERWAAVDFDPQNYRVRQQPTMRVPFAEALPVQTVVFDAPYFSLEKAPSVHGAVSWGAHDPGVEESARPAGLTDEIKRRFGPYPATRWIYGFVWPWKERARQMADDLIKAVNLRGDITSWLLGERCPDWRLGYVVISEYHSAIEALWHGVDPAHPLHGAASSGDARRGVEGVYEAADRMLGRLMDQFKDADIVAFNLHGMGANDSDPASMALLPELLFRHAFGDRLLEATGGLEIRTTLDYPTWPAAVDAAFPRSMRQRGEGLLPRLARRIGVRRDQAGSLDWMPAARYRKYWRDMPAFALPSFYDGRVRINLQGRESEGHVAPRDFDAACDTIEALLHACRDSVTGEPVVERIIRNGKKGALTGSEADLEIVWRGPSLSFDHPTLGRIGPLPYRRTGGHTGKSGVAYIAGRGVQPGAAATRSAFDVVPTIIEMLGEGPLAGVSGESFHALMTAPSMPRSADAGVA